MKKSLFIAGSDWHLMSTPPVCRKEEKDWWGVMEKNVMTMVDKANELDVPLVIAGDFFDKWWGEAKSVELLNKVITWLSKAKAGVFGIPGQHDLPENNTENVERSAYAVLSKQKNFFDSSGGGYTGEEFLFFHGWGFGSDITKNQNKKSENWVQIAVIHELAWKDKEPYPGAPASGNYKAIAKKLKNYDIIVAGDCHIGFSEKIGNQLFVNPGSMMRLKADQIGYRPRAYVVYQDGKDFESEALYLPCEDDIITRDHIDNKAEKKERLFGFVENLKTEEGEETDLEEVVRSTLRNSDISKETEKETLSILDESST